MLFYWFQDDFFQTDLQERKFEMNKNNSNNNNASRLGPTTEGIESVGPVASLEWLPDEKYEKIAKLLDPGSQYEIRYKYDWTPNPKLPL